MFGSLCKYSSSTFATHSFSLDSILLYILSSVNLLQTTSETYFVEKSVVFFFVPTVSAAVVGIFPASVGVLVDASPSLVEVFLNLKN